MIDKDFELIETILENADQYGLMWEVEYSAQKIINETPDINHVEAYEIAFNEWIK